METGVFDLRRIFLGELPWTYLFEILFRTVFLYTFTFLLVRLMARRAVGTLSMVEVLLIVALGSAVGDPMMNADVPLLHGMVVISTVVLLNQAFGALVTRSERTETLLEGKAARVLLEGRLDLEGMRSAGLGEQELFEQLRAHEITQLGQVRAAYLEQNGILSVFRYTHPEERSGLPIEPPADVEPREQYGEGAPAPATSDYACSSCGEVRHFEVAARFSPCEQDHTSWVTAVGGPSMASSP